MNKPPINVLLSKVDSKYTLIIIAAKRARQIIAENPEVLQSGKANPVTLALNDIVDGNIIWTKKKKGL